MTPAKLPISKFKIKNERKNVENPQNERTAQILLANQLLKFVKNTQKHFVFSSRAIIISLAFLKRRVDCSSPGQLFLSPDRWLVSELRPFTRFRLHRRASRIELGCPTFFFFFFWLFWPITLSNLRLQRKQ